MKIQIQYGNGVCTIPLRALTEENAERVDLLVLMHLSAEPSLADNPELLANKVGCSRKNAESAIDFWFERGILVKTDESHLEQPFAEKTDVPQIHKIPEEKLVGSDFVRPPYNSDKLAEMVGRDDGMIRALIDECQRITGKVFSPTESWRVASLVEHLGLEVEHVLLLFTYCARHEKKSIAYIEKLAYQLYNDGIDTADKFDEYTKRKDEYDQDEELIKRTLDIKERSPIKREVEAFEKWTREWNLEIGLIRRAYEDTVLKTGKYTLAYMSKILETMHENGIDTVEKAQAQEQQFREDKENKIKAAETALKEKKSEAKNPVKTKPQSEKNKGSFDTDEFVELALRRSYGNAYKATDENKPQ